MTMILMIMTGNDNEMSNINNESNDNKAKMIMNV